VNLSFVQQSKIDHNLDLHVYPEPLPFYRFAVASVATQAAHSAIDISISYPAKVYKPDGPRQLIEDSYIVSIPQFDGDDVVDVKFQERTRQHEIGVTQQLSPSENCYDRFEFYTITIPYTYYLENGVKTHRSRNEFRKRQAASNEVVTEFSPNPQTSRYTLDELDCYSPAGKPLSAKQILRRLKKPTSVILVNDRRFISDYFATLLRPSDDHGVVI